MLSKQWDVVVTLWFRVVDSRQISPKVGLMLRILDLDINCNVDPKCINMIWHDQFLGLTWMWPTFKDHWLWLPFNRFAVQLKGNDKSMIGQRKCIQYEMAESECLQTLEILFENNKLKRLTKRGGNIIH